MFITNIFCRERGIPENRSPDPVVARGKTGGTTAAATLTANKVPFRQLHVNPVDVDMIRYFDDIIISTRDPVQRFVSALNNMLPGGEVPYRNPVFIQCFPNVSVAADVIFDDTECGAMLRRGPSHLGIGYCFYMGGKAAREALKYHRPRVHHVQQESFDADMESVLRVVGKKVPPFVVPKSVHTKTHLSKEMSSSGAAKLRAWLELIGEYDLYRELKALQT